VDGVTVGSLWLREMSRRRPTRRPPSAAARWRCRLVGIRWL